GAPRMHPDRARAWRPVFAAPRGVALQARRAGACAVQRHAAPAARRCSVSRAYPDPGLQPQSGATSFAALDRVMALSAGHAARPHFSASLLAVSVEEGPDQG